MVHLMLEALVVTPENTSDHPISDVQGGSRKLEENAVNRCYKGRQSADLETKRGTLYGSLMLLTFLFSCSGPNDSGDSAKNACSVSLEATLQALCLTGVSVDVPVGGHFVYKDGVQKVAFQSDESKEQMEVMYSVARLVDGRYQTDEDDESAFVEKLVDLGSLTVVQRGGCDYEAGFYNAILLSFDSELGISSEIYGTIAVNDFSGITVSIADSSSCEVYRDDTCYKELAPISLSVSVAGETQTIFGGQSADFDNTSVFVDLAEISRGTYSCDDGPGTDTVLRWRASAR